MKKKREYVRVVEFCICSSLSGRHGICSRCGKPIKNPFRQPNSCERLRFTND